MQPVKKLYRSEKNKMIAGICGGLGEYFNVDPTLVRVVFLIGLVLWGASAGVYLLMWFIIPSESSSSSDYVGENMSEMRKSAEKAVNKVVNAVQSAGQQAKTEEAKVVEPEQPKSE